MGHRPFHTGTANRKIRTIGPEIDAERDEAERETRAEELEALGRSRLATRVRECRRNARSYFVCRSRFCPKCAAVKAAQDALKVRDAAAAFRHPQFITLTFPSAGPWALGDALDGLIRSLGLFWRDPAVLRELAAMVGGIEPRLGADGTLWTPHVHLIVDSRSRDPNWRALQDAWERATEGRGRFLLPSDGPGVRAPCAAASYVTKSQDWCPTPGTLSREAFKVLVEAVHGRRLRVARGAVRRPARRSRERGTATRGSARQARPPKGRR